MIGAALRYGSGRLAPVPAGAFPWSTFAMNVLGSLALGVLTTVTSARWPDRHTPRWFLGVGVAGAFTTFSAFANETRALLLAQQGATAFWYVVSSLGAGLALAWLGVVLAQRALGQQSGPIPEQPEEATRAPALDVPVAGRLNVAGHPLDEHSDHPHNHPLGVST
jgi:CrcB protein